MTKNSWLNFINFYILAEKPNKINFFIFEAKKFCENRCQKKTFFWQIFFHFHENRNLFFWGPKKWKDSYFRGKKLVKKKTTRVPPWRFFKKFFFTQVSLIKCSKFLSDFFFLKFTSKNELKCTFQKKIIF